MTEHKWFFKDNRHYLLITAEEKDHIYHDESQDVVRFWTAQIQQAK